MTRQNRKLIICFIVALILGMLLGSIGDAKGTGGGRGGGGGARSSSVSAKSSSVSAAKSSAVRSAVQRGVGARTGASKIKSGKSFGKAITAPLRTSKRHTNAYTPQHLYVYNNWLYYGYLTGHHRGVKRMKDELRRRDDSVKYTITVEQDGRERLLVVSPGVYEAVKVGGVVRVDDGKVTVLR